MGSCCLQFFDPLSTFHSACKGGFNVLPLTVLSSL